MTCGWFGEVFHQAAVALGRRAQPRPRRCSMPNRPIVARAACFATSRGGAAEGGIRPGWDTPESGAARPRSASRTNDLRWMEVSAPVPSGPLPIGVPPSRTAPRLWADDGERRHGGPARRRRQGGRRRPGPPARGGGGPRLPGHVELSPGPTAHRGKRRRPTALHRVGCRGGSSGRRGGPRRPDTWAISSWPPRSRWPTSRPGWPRPCRPRGARGGP
jgi:hypothetical protein